jgi:hypothetical protein
VRDALCVNVEFAIFGYAVDSDSVQVAVALGEEGDLQVNEDYLF